MRSRAFASSSVSFFAFAAVIAACGSSSSSSNGGSDTGDGGGGSTGPTSTDAAGIYDGAAVPTAPTLPSSLACNAPIAAVDVAKPTTVVGTGTMSSCTEAALAAAVSQGGIVTFDCGSAPATITLTASLAPSKTVDTTIDGGGTVTLDGGGAVRILAFTGPAYHATTTTITVQRLTFAHGRAHGTVIPTAPAPCSQGYMTDGGGGAISVTDGVLHVIDSVFTDNAGDTPGPDVAGGAIFVNGSIGTVVVGSQFGGNTASNGGAIGSLNTDLSIYSSTFEGNSATGTGQNSASSKCTATKSMEVGDGGNGGAISMDGGSDGNATFCGSVFKGNHANALGGSIFRVYDGAQHEVDIRATTFDSNVADGPVGRSGAGPGAGALYFHNVNLNVDATTFSGNASVACGALQIDSSTMTFTNTTFSGNQATAGVGGAVCAYSGGSFTNCTFAGNSVAGGANYFGGATFGAALTFDNTIFANQTSTDPYSGQTCGKQGMGTRDLQWPTTHSTGGGMDSACVPGIAFSDPMLGALANNGGPTATQIPGAAATVIQTGTACPKYDQAGNPRGNPCTLGAVEAASK